MICGEAGGTAGPASITPVAALAALGFSVRSITSSKPDWPSSETDYWIAVERGKIIPDMDGLPKTPEWEEEGK